MRRASDIMVTAPYDVTRAEKEYESPHIPRLHRMYNERRLSGLASVQQEAAAIMWALKKIDLLEERLSEYERNG